MSLERSEIIQQALAYLEEDYKRVKKASFVKISARSGVKNDGSGNFSPVHFWLDQANSESQIKVKEKIRYSGGSVNDYLTWVNRVFFRFISDNRSLDGYVASQSIDKDGTKVPFRNYLTILIPIPDGDFTKEEFYLQLNTVMSKIFEIIFSNIASPTSSSTTTGAGSEYLLAPKQEAVQFSLGSSNVMEDYDEVYAYQYIKTRSESEIAKLASNKMAMYHVTGSARQFDYDTWWKNLPTLYVNNSTVLNILQQLVKEVVPITMPAPGAATEQVVIMYFDKPVLQDGKPEVEIQEFKRLRSDGSTAIDKREVEKTERVYVKRTLDDQGRYSAGSKWETFNPTDDEKKLAIPAPNTLKTAAIFRRTSPQLKAVDKSGNASGRQFTLYQLGLKQTSSTSSRTPAESPESDETDEDEETSESEERADESEGETRTETNPESSSESSPTPPSAPSSVDESESPLGISVSDFESIWESLTSRTSNIDVNKVVTAINLFNRGSNTPEKVIDVIVKRVDLEQLMTSLFDAIESDLNNRSKQISEGYQRTTDTLKNISDIGGKAIQNLMQGLKETKSPTRGKL